MSQTRSFITFNGRTTSPCHNCKDREMGCHSKCEKYIDFRKVHDDEVEVIRENRRKAHEGY